MLKVLKRLLLLRLPKTLVFTESGVTCSVLLHLVFTLQCILYFRPVFSSRKPTVVARLPSELCYMATALLKTKRRRRRRMRRRRIRRRRGSREEEEEEEEEEE